MIFESCLQWHKLTTEAVMDRNKQASEIQRTNQGFICFLIWYASEYKRKQPLFDTTQKRIVHINLVMIQTILNMIPRQLMRASHTLQPMAKLSDECPMLKKDLN